MPPAMAQNRPLYYVERSMRRHLRETGGQRYEFRPTRVTWGIAVGVATKEQSLALGSCTVALLLTSSGNSYGEYEQQ